MKNYVLAVSKLSKSIKGHLILDNISLKVKAGEICGVTGRNASGKSMLFKCIANIVVPTSGTIEIFGNVSKSFGQERVLKSVSRDFEKGKIHGIVGNNGSGKTVLMKCICGFLIPTEGTVTVNGRRVGRDVDFPPDLGLIIETPGFLPNLSGAKNLEILSSLNKKIGLRKSRIPFAGWDLTPS